jgi:hypothetical protein
MRANCGSVDGTGVLDANEGRGGSGGGSLARTGITVGVLVALAVALILGGRLLRGLAAHRGSAQTAR